MNLTGGIVLFATIWFLVFLMVLPVRFTSQRDAGEVVPGTSPSAPSEAHIVRKAQITTAIAAVLWAVIAWVILSGAITIRDLDWFHRLPPETQAG
jgi:predicted secreted protein